MNDQFSLGNNFYDHKKISINGLLQIIEVQASQVCKYCLETFMFNLV